MLPNRSIAGWGCLGILLVSIEAAGARSPSSGTAKPIRAEFPYVEFLPAPTASPVPVVSRATRFAQNAPDRDNIPSNTPNPANLSLQMSPDQLVGVGTKISFRIKTQKPGYLLLVDIDADGKMSQIFPSPEMIAQSQEAATNFIKPGQELLIPNSAARALGFEYVVTPPLGEAAVVALLSDRRVQIIDLPDNAPTQRTGADAISYLAGWTRELRVPDSSTGKLLPSNWSLAIMHYSIK